MRFGPLTLIVALTALPGGLPPAAAQGTEPLDPALLARLERLVET